MNILVADPCRGRPEAELLLMDGRDFSLRRRVRVGYVPEVVLDAHTRELIVVDTDLVQTNGVATRFWLKTFDADTLDPRVECEIPVRPMYAGFPGRSHRVAADPGGRFIYPLQATPCRFDSGDIGFRTTVNRYDRLRNELTPGAFHIDSCYLDFGCLDESAGEFYFHLSCDRPNTIALANFASAEPIFVQMDALEPRTHTPRETCASWLDRTSGALFCATGEGTIQRIHPRSRDCVRLLTSPLREPATVPLCQLCGADGFLWLGVSGNDDERGMGLASEIWQIDQSNGRTVRVLCLPEPVMNFAVDPPGDLLVGVNPFSQALVAMELRTGDALDPVLVPGLSPAEVIFVP